MYLHIAPTKLISDIQKEFNSVYPFLKLEFFSKRKNKQAGVGAAAILPGSKKIEEAQAASKKGELMITDKMKVKELELALTEQFALSVQVFRRSGNLWLETTMTDEWTLKQQNNHGKELSTGQPKESREDFDLSRDADH